MSTTRSLSALDMAFLLLESKERMSNIGPLAILKVPPGSGGPKRFADRLMREMKKRPAGAPFNLRYRPPSVANLPMLETVDEVDLDAHCHRVTLEGPADNAQLYEAVCRLHEQRLDRSRPLWAFFIIDGLTEGRIALYAKMHHGTIDGRGFVEACTRWFATEPEDKAVRALWEGLPQRKRSAATSPPALDLVAIGNATAGVAKTMVSLYRALGRQALASAKLVPGMPLPFIGAPSALRSVPQVQRILGVCVLPLAQMKAFGKTQGASINDLLLTVLDMAVTRYLADKGRSERQRPLVADMPVALGEAGKGGNQVAVLQFPLGTPGATPMGRLAQIRQRTAEVKRHVKATGMSALITYTAAVHGVPALMEMLKIDRGPVLANMVISNPFGLMEHRWLAGAELQMIVPLNMLAPGQSLSITAVTYDQGLQVAFMGLEAELPDIQALADMTAEALDELRAAGRRGRARQDAA